jgi:hypothetical protein
MYDEEETISKSAWLLWIVFGIIIILVLIFSTYSLRVVIMNLEREAIQQSNNYVEGRVLQLHAMYDEYLVLESDIIRYENTEGDYTELIVSSQNQQTALINRMDAIASSIDISEVPREIKELLHEK